MESIASWLVIAAGDDRQHAGNRGYQDNPASHYLWDNTVPNHKLPNPGDLIVLWDKRELIGISVIESISNGNAVKDRLRCPRCSSAGIKKRKRQRPVYKCHGSACRAEFDDPEVQEIKVETYKSGHSGAWLEMPGALSGDDLRKLCINPKSQHSIRQLNTEAFLRRIEANGFVREKNLFQRMSDMNASSGHVNSVVRVRRGQQRFRSKLIELFGEVCAFSGNQPAAVMDAAHLYSYAKEGKHDDHGGLLLRKDLHRLFDLGHISIDPTDLVLDLDDYLLQYPGYAGLHRQALKVEVSMRGRSWIKQHWKEHRG